MQFQAKARDPKFTFIAVSALGSIICVLAIWNLLFAPSSEEAQVYSALGCRSSATVLILKVTPDGMVRATDNSTYTLEEARLLLPTWIRQAEDPVVAIMATEDTPTSLVLPLLAVAEDLGHRRAIFAINKGSSLALLSDQRGKVDHRQ